MRWLHQLLAHQYLLVSTKQPTILQCVPKELTLSGAKQLAPPVLMGIFALSKPRMAMIHSLLVPVALTAQVASKLCALMVTLELQPVQRLKPMGVPSVLPGTIVFLGLSISC
jgi:hypothetical protein